MSPDETTSTSSELTLQSSFRPEIVFVLGGPGAGKGTQCQLIVENFGFVHLSAGDLLRAERAQPGSQYGELIEEHIRNGTIVPVEITCSLIERAINANIVRQREANKQSGDNVHVQPNGGDSLAPRTGVVGKFLIDGFPRNQDNFDGWQRAMSSKVDVKFVLAFDCPEQVCVDRCLERGAGGSGRSDDNEQSLRKRLVTFLNETKPIIEYYEKLNLVRHVDANRSKEAIFADVKALFQS